MPGAPVGGGHVLFFQGKTTAMQHDPGRNLQPCLHADDPARAIKSPNIEPTATWDAIVVRPSGKTRL